MPTLRELTEYHKPTTLDEALKSAAPYQHQDGTFSGRHEPGGRSGARCASRGRSQRA